MANNYTDQINNAYQSAFGRPADAGGLDYWAQQLQSGGVTDLYKALGAGAQGADTSARDDIAAGGVDTSKTWGNGASMDKPLSYDAANNTWGSAPAPQDPFQSNFAMTAPTLRTYEKNPYLDQMAQGITSQMNDNFSRSVAPQLRSGAMAAGGFGGSRQGVVEANASNDLNRSLGQNLTNLYGQDYQAQQGRNLQEFQGNQSYNLGLGGLANQRQSLNNQYDLGLRSSDLGFAGLDANINQNNFNNRMAGANFGLSAYNTLQNGNNLGLTAGKTMQDTPLNYQTYFNNAGNAAGGIGQQTTGTVNRPGSPLTGAVGGLQLANAFNKSNPYSSGGDITQNASQWQLG